MPLFKEDPPPLFGKYLILVGCGKSKRAVRSQAKDLYTGSLTAMSIRWAERNSDRWFILSAKFGMLAPDQLVDPYNLKMDQLSREECGAWGDEFWEQWTQNVPPAGPAPKVVVMAGKDYLDAIRFPPRMEVYTPLAGMKMGDRMAWLKANPLLTKKILSGCRHAAN